MRKEFPGEHLANGDKGLSSCMHSPVANGVRLRFGVALVGGRHLLRRNSNAGIGFLIIKSYSILDMPERAFLILLFALATLVNVVVSWSTPKGVRWLRLNQ